jgi:hypothetical protein
MKHHDLKHHTIRTLIHIVVLLAPSSFAAAQHSDVEFSYAGGQIDVEFGPDGPVFEGDFPTSGALNGFTTEPGFASEVDEGLGIGPGDAVHYNVRGPFRYHNGSAFAPTAATITGDDRPAGTVVINSDTTTAEGLIGDANGVGDFHSDPGWFLSVPAAIGAYGVLLNLETDAPGIAASDPFYLVFNYGLDEPNFDAALLDFAAAVPEPATLSLLTLGTLMLLRRRH